MIVILLTDGVITSQYYNVTVSKGIAFTLTCSSKCKSGSCEVVWTTDKMSVFVRNDKYHTIWSTPPYKHEQTHYLTVHSASSSTSYHCLLIAITGKILDSAEQRVYIKEPGECSHTRTDRASYIHYRINNFNVVLLHR